MLNGNSRVTSGAGTRSLFPSGGPNGRGLQPFVSGGFINVNSSSSSAQSTMESVASTSTNAEASSVIPKRAGMFTDQAGSNPTMQESLQYGTDMAFANAAADETAVDALEVPTMTMAIGEGAGFASGLAETALDPLAIVGGMAIGTGLSHLPDLAVNQAQQTLQSVYNPNERINEERSITSLQGVSTDAQLGAAIGSIVPVVGSAIGAGIGAAIGSSQEVTGADLSSPTETAQL